MTIQNEEKEEIKYHCEICMEEIPNGCITPREYDERRGCTHSACVDCWRGNKSGKCFYCMRNLPYNFPPKTDEEIQCYVEYLNQYILSWEPYYMEIRHRDLMYFNFDVQSLIVLPTHFPHITHLSIYMGNVFDLGPLRGLTQLNHLELHDNKVSDLEPISNLVNLTYLNLGSNDISNLEHLRCLTNLTRLVIDYNPISNVDPIRGLTNLKYLSMNSNDAPNFDIIHDLPNLTHFRIHGYDNYDSLPVRDGLYRFF
jgi:hypothetical protein